MRSEEQRPQFLPSSAGTTWLFWSTLCFGIFLAVYIPYKLWTGAEHQIDLSGPELVSFFGYFLAGLAAVMGVRWCVLFILSYATMARRELGLLSDEDGYWPFVSILAPAYNEADCVRDAISGLIQLDYPAYEVVFVDDGSTDNTYQLAREFEGRHSTEHGICNVRVLTKPNGGKWSAHNYGLKHASGNFVLCIDADSRIEPNSLRLMVRHMRDPRVGAVSGQIRVRNRKSLLGLLQAFEYVLANGALRLSQGSTGSVVVVPGPIGLFRREALERAQLENEQGQSSYDPAIRGPFSPLTFAEDFHLSLSLLAMGYRVEYEPHAIAHTKAPSNLAGLISQRYRWTRGTMQVVLWFLSTVARGDKSPLRVKSWIAAVFLADVFFFPALSFVLLASLLTYVVHGGNLSNLASWAAALWVLNAMSGSLYAVAHRDRISLSLLSPLFDFYQGILLNCAWVIAAFDQARGARMRW